MYVDYLSSGSREFQLANVQQLAEWVSEDAATLSYYPVAMLTAKSNGTKYSLRAASAAACVGHALSRHLLRVHQRAARQQPDVDSDGYTDSELADLAIASGADVAQGRARVHRGAGLRDVGEGRRPTGRCKGLPDTDDVALTGTPMILVNGTPYVGALDDPKEFAQFVLTIASDAYYKESGEPRRRLRRP